MVPVETFAKSPEHGLVTKTLLGKSKRVPLRIMNLSQDIKLIHSGTFVASMSPADKKVDSEEQPSYKKSLTPALNEL